MRQVLFLTNFIFMFSMMMSKSKCLICKGQYSPSSADIKKNKEDIKQLLTYPVYFDGANTFFG